MKPMPPETNTPPMASPPLVTVVIPARNAQATLAQTLASVCAQDHSVWEAIVVDDGSTDTTAELAAEWAARDGRIRCIAGPRTGVSAARNAAIAQARGEFIAFIDSDDLWLPGKLSAHLRHFARCPQVGLGFSRILFVDEQAQSTGVLSTARVSGLAAHEFLYENPACTASTLVARSSALREVGGFDETMRFAEDLELMVRMRCRSRWGVEGIAEVLTHYRANPNGASSNLDAMQLGWETLMDKVRVYAPALVQRHVAGARAVHLRYLARRSVRLGQPAKAGLAYFGRALCSSPVALLRDPRRTLGTLAALLGRLVTAPLLRRASALRAG
jgi:glycosyltransferase involved in cell wall biosynthesis